MPKQCSINIESYLSYFLNVKIHFFACFIDCKMLRTWNIKYDWTYCRIILIYGGQCSWIVKILLVHGDALSWVTGLLCVNPRQFIILLNISGDVNLWVRVTHQIHDFWSPKNKDDSSLCAKIYIIFIIFFTKCILGIYLKCTILFFFKIE